MKKQLLTLTALLGLSLMLFSCSDDTAVTPDTKEDVTYMNTSITSYTYNEYDLDTSNVEIPETRHQDSLSHKQEATKDGKAATEYSVFTNVEGSYMDDGSEFYAGETNKLYAHLSVFQSLFGNIESSGFSLETLFDGTGDWFLIADAKATSSWNLYSGKRTFKIAELPATEADVVISMTKSGTESMTINGKVTSVDKYSLNANVKATVLLQDIDFDVKGAFWVAPNIGVVKSNVNSFTVPLADLPVEGSERVLVNYTMQGPA